MIRYNSQICYVDNIHALSKACRCSTCDTYFQKSVNLERQVVRCSERVKHIYPNNVNQLRETLFDKLDSFHIQYAEDQKLFINLAVFDFESICIPEEKVQNIRMTSWIGRHVPILVSISSNLIALPIFLRNSNPLDLVETFIDTVEGLATQSKAQKKLNFLEVETAIKSKMTWSLESLNGRCCRNQCIFEFDDHCFEDDNKEKGASTQLLQVHKNQLIEFQDHLERYCNVLPVFGSNSAKNDITLIKSYLLPILIIERNMEATVIKKTKQFVSFIFGGVQLLGSMISLGGATRSDSFLKAFKYRKLKVSFSMKDSIVHKRWLAVNFPLTTHFWANLETWTPCKRTFQTIKNYLAADWKVKKHYLEWSFPNNRLQEKKTTNIWLIYGIMKLCAHLKTFYAGTTTKQQKRSPSTRSNAKNACVSSQYWNQHVQTRVYTSDFGEKLFPKIYQCQFLSYYWNR